MEVDAESRTAPERPQSDSTTLGPLAVCLYIVVLLAFLGYPIHTEAIEDLTGSPSEGKTAVDTYLVRLANREGEGQQVLVQDKNPDRDWQEWIDSAADSFDPPLTITNPQVMHVQRLRMKRPVKTVLPQATAV